jgi:hypothetical protein
LCSRDYSFVHNGLNNALNQSEPVAYLICYGINMQLVKLKSLASRELQIFTEFIYVLENVMEHKMFVMCSSVNSSMKVHTLNII